MPIALDPKPAAFCVRYEDDAAYGRELRRLGGASSAIDGACIEDFQDARTLAEARRIRRKIERDGIGSCVRIYQRTHVYERVTSDGDFTMWEWDEELVED